MSLSPALLVLPAVSAALPLSGYTVAARCQSVSPGQRLAIATLAGLALLLFNASVANFFLPLTPPVAAFCLWPILATCVVPGCIRLLATDVRAAFAGPRGAVAVVMTSLSFAALLLPELRRDAPFYYDGTGSHDGYFWISGAKRLQSHSYMDTVVRDPEHPWANLTTAISGWDPDWGRAAAENLLAATASLTGFDPSEVYLPVTAALFFAWTTAVYLVARAFWIHRCTAIGVAALFSLHPLFVFFRANANLPNLLGALCAAAGLVAFTRALHRETDRIAWLILLALSVHALLHAYPELLPFVAFSCALLAARALIRHETAQLHAPFVAILVGFAINPATTFRAAHGFVHSFNNARIDVDWVNTFAPLHAAQYPAALTTLSLPFVLFLGPALCAAVALILFGAFALAFRAAHDRYAAFASLAGGILLAIYTAATDFSYGWQKSAQFAAVFLAAALPVAAFQAAFSAPPGLRLRAIHRVAGAGIAAIFTVAVIFHLFELHKGSHRKALTHDWTQLADYTAQHLRDARIRIEPATFPMSFFHSMWATYFLRDSRVIFPSGADRPGGYLATTVAIEDFDPANPPSAILLGPAAEPPAGSTPLLITPSFRLIAPPNIRLPPEAP